MSLKFTAMGRLPLLSTIGTGERAEDPLESSNGRLGGRRAPRAAPKGRAVGTLCRALHLLRRSVDRLPCSQRIGSLTCAALRPGDLSPLLRHC